jgi:hypothetical protein
LRERGNLGIYFALAFALTFGATAVHAANRDDLIPCPMQRAKYGKPLGARFHLLCLV